MKRCLGLGALVVAFSWPMLTWSTLSFATLRTYLPPSPDTVIYVIPESMRSLQQDATLKDAEQKILKDPKDLETALLLAGRWVEQARRTTDPRLYARAQSYLQPWWQDTTQSRIDFLMLRSTISQFQHQFDPALADLKRVLDQKPDEVQAILNQAQIQLVVGRKDEAQASCGKLHRLEKKAAFLCQMQLVVGTKSNIVAVTSLQGQFDIYAKIMSDEDLWGISIYALSTLYQEQKKETLDAVEQLASDLPQNLGYNLQAIDSYDHFKECAKPRALMNKLTPSPALFVRELKWQRRCGDAAGQKAAEQTLGDWLLRDQTDTASPHMREQAWAAYLLRGDACQAADLAAANWLVQRERIDWEIFEAAQVGCPKEDRKLLLANFAKEWNFPDFVITKDWP